MTPHLQDLLSENVTDKTAAGNLRVDTSGNVFSEAGDRRLSRGDNSPAPGLRVAALAGGPGGGCDRGRGHRLPAAPCPQAGRPRVPLVVQTWAECRWRAGALGEMPDSQPLMWGEDGLPALEVRQ